MRLTAGPWTATLRPEIGGGLATLDRAGAAILRAAPPGADDPLELASFPLVPYANRIAEGVFSFGGETIHLPRNRPGEAHALHGLGWLMPWTIDRHDAAAATLTHRHEADAAWPWSYAAVQTFALDDRGLSTTLAITSRDRSPMPVSLGFHPYFSRSPVRGLSFQSEGVWLMDETMLLPTREAAPDALGDWARGGSVTRSDMLNHSYFGWDGSVRIARDDGDVMLHGTGTGLLHLYLPPGEDFLCVEPVTAMPDAMNRGGADVLETGATRTIGMRIGDA